MQWFKTHAGAMAGAVLAMALVIVPIACVPKTASTLDPTKRVSGPQLQIEQSKAVADLATDAAKIKQLQATYAADLQSKIDAYNTKSAQEQEEFATAAADLQAQADKISAAYTTVGNLATSIIGSVMAGRFDPTTIFAGVAGLLGTAGLAGGAAGAMAHASVTSFKLAQLNKPWNGADRRGGPATNLQAPTVADGPTPIGDGITAAAGAALPIQKAA